MNCAKCDRDASTAKDVIKCVECEASYHAACCRIRSLAKLTAMTSRSRASWKCDDCKMENEDTSSQASIKSDSDDPKIYEILLSIQKEITSSKVTNKEGFCNLEKQLSSMQLSIDSLNEKIIAVETENAALKAECVDLRSKNVSLTRRVSEAELQLIDVQQYSRNRNIEIKGIPITKNEDVYCILESVGKVLGVPYERQSISVAHRLPAPRGKPLESSIIAQFISRSTRADWLIAARKKKLSTKDLIPTLRPGPILILDHLSAHNKQLLSRAKSLVREGKLAFAWSRDGKIMVRKAPDSAARRIRTIDEVESIVHPGGAVDGGGLDTVVSG